MKKQAWVCVCIAVIGVVFLSLVITGKNTAQANIKDIQFTKSLKAIGLNPVFTQATGEHVLPYMVQPGDTLGKIAKKFETTAALIKKRNNLKSDTIRVGQKLIVWTGRFDLLVFKSKNILQLKVGENIVKIYPVATGKPETGTPSGTYTIISKLTNPVWYHGGKAYPPGHPENGLGTRWMGFDMEGYGIHGTIHPDQIGQPVSAGCVRMLNTDVEELFDLIPEGTKVSIVDN